MGIEKELEVAQPKPQTASCEKCKLFEGCKKPYFAVKRDTRPEVEYENRILVVGDHPDTRDQSGAGGYYHRGYTQFQESILKSLDCRWVFTTAVRCPIDARIKKPTKRQNEICSDEFLYPLIVQEKPRSIVCVGKEALNQTLRVLNMEVPRNFNTLKGGYLAHEELNLRIYAVEHFATYTRPDANIEALEQHYYDVFSKAEAFACETEYREAIQFKLIQTPMELMELANKRFSEVAFDIETNYPIEDKRGTKDPKRNNIYKENARCISMSATIYNESLRKYENYVVVGEALKDKFALRRLFRDRRVIAHNCLTGDSLVTMADGSRIPIQTLVKERHLGPVLSLNEKTGKVEPKAITGWLHNPRREWNDWLKVRAASGAHLSITVDHKVYTQRGWIVAGELLVGDSIHTQYGEDKVVEIRGLLGSDRDASSEAGIGPYQYCLEVEDNHNFFASGLCVSNCKFDINGVAVLLDVDILAICKSFEDTQLCFYLSDQNRLYTNLKDLARHYLEGVGDWESAGHELIVKANLAVEKRRRELKDQIQHYGKLYRLYLDVYKPGIDRVMLAAERRKWLNAKAKLQDYNDEFEIFKILRGLRDELEKLPQPGLCSYEDIPIVKLAEYNAEDTLRTLQLWREIIPALERIEGHTYIPECYEMVKEFVRTLCYIEQEGFRINVDKLNKLDEELNQESEAAVGELLKIPAVLEAAKKTKAYIEAERKGIPIPWNKVVSLKNDTFMPLVARHYGVYQLGNQTATKVTFGKLVIPNILKNLDKRPPSALVEEAVFVFEKLETLRFNRDLQSKFINNWRVWLCPDGKFHCDYRVTKNLNIGYARGKDVAGGAQSGRLAAQRINLQQIYKLERLREIFEPGPNAEETDEWFIAELDYKSLEPMLMAYVTDCKRLKDVFWKGLDIYRVTCNDVYRKGIDIYADDLDQVKAQLKDPNVISDKERKLFKAGVLAWVYGAGIKKLSMLLGISEDEAKYMVSRLIEAYPEIHEWKNSIRDTIKEGGFGYNVLGRRWTLPVLEPQDYSEEEKERYRKDFSTAFRIGVNRPIQSLGSDICLTQISRIRRWIEKNNYHNVVKICNAVHDSVWVYVRKSHAYLVEEIKALMEDLSVFPIEIDVPLTIEYTVGYNLAESMGLDHQQELQAQRRRELGLPQAA